MPNTGTLEVSTPSDREVVLRRVFDAPRSLVFDALTKPELLKRWFGADRSPMVDCEVDLRAGGRWVFVLRHRDGDEMRMRGEYREIARPERLVYTESFDGYPGESLVTAILSERDGKTTLTATILCESREIRDAFLATGMEDGAAETYDRLAEVLPSMALSR